MIENMKTSARSACAFSRIDLVSIMGVLGIFALMQVCLFARSSHESAGTSCRNNLRRLTLAWQLYADDNGGKLLGAAASGSGTPGWSGGEWLDIPSNDPAEYDPALSIQQSPLWRYAPDHRIWKCPADFTFAINATNSEAVPRVRSYSMNNWMGGPGWGASESSGPWKVFSRMADLTDPGPSKTFLLIDEHEQSINDAYFVVDMSGYPNLPNLWTIVDYPADRHSNGANLSFADGHVEAWIWKDARTRPPRVNGPMPLNVSSTNNLDVLRLQSAATGKR